MSARVDCFRLSGIAEGNVRRFIKTDKGVVFDKDMPSYDITKMVPIEARAGSVVLLDGSLIHMRCVPKSSIV